MKHEFYLNVAKEISKISKCLRSHFGVVIVKNDMIIGTGYNGPVRGAVHCDPCKRADYPSGQGYDKCIAVHAEVNGIIQAGGREGCLGATMYIDSHNKKFDGTIYNKGMGNFPCDNCARVIVNAGIEWLVQNELGHLSFEDILEEKVVVYNIPQLVKEGRLR
jgi:dCMP deaminase